MQVNVSIGQNHHFALREAMLIYRSTENQNGSFGNTFITHHEVNTDNPAKQPTLGPAKTLTIEFVQSLVQALGGRVSAPPLSSPELSAPITSLTELRI
jgi:hypothetical protein